MRECQLEQVWLIGQERLEIKLSIKIEQHNNVKVAADFSKVCFKRLHQKEKLYLGFAGLSKSEDWIL